ncbi:MAG TPA: purine-nucleoside phosphorylase, partial [Clostridiales bacterium]|nr:purine-nucleoside phosphorylase [Clostridiales bacterium]
KDPVAGPYSKELNGLLDDAARRTNNRIERGCYAYMTGPSFETKAEIKYLSLLGADTVGMSTVPETVRAKELGLEAACISRVSNFAAGMTGGPLSHAEVLEAAKSSQEGFISLLKEFVTLL